MDQDALRAQALRHPQARRPRDPVAATCATARSSTCRRSRRARSSTRACCSRTRSASTTSTCTTSRWCRRWRWCTSASRPTRSRRGTWRIRSASSATTARSTRCAATSTGFARAKARSRRRSSATTCTKLWPLIYDGQSDSASFDNALELLVMGGYPLAHAMMMMIPEAWAGNPLMDEDRRAFYEYHAALMEPWDGPAAMAFTDGRQIGATLDRNGLRPARFVVTDDDYIVMASEVGVLDIPETQDRQEVAPAAGQDAAGRPRGGPHRRRRRTEAHARDRKSRIASGSTQCRLRLEDMPEPAPPTPSEVPLLDRQQAFGYTQEDVKLLLTPMAQNGEEPLGSMGNDAALPVLSDRPKVFYNYFKQLFAQVTNPPIDPIREELVMSLVSFIGPRPEPARHRRHRAADAARGAAADPDAGQHGKDPARRAVFRRRVPLGRARHLLSGGVGRQRHGSGAREPRRARRGCDPPGLQHPHPVRPQRGAGRVADSRAARDRGRARASGARRGCARPTGLVVETGTAREVHHFALLAGYGAEAIHPYLALETLARDLARIDSGDRRQGIAEALHQGDLQGPVQGDVEDGHLDVPVLLRRADLRGGRAAEGVRRQVFHRHGEQRRGHRPVRGGRGIGAHACAGVRRRSAAARHARRRRRVPVPHPRRSAHVDAGDRSPSCSTRRARTATRRTATTRSSSTSRAAS